MSAIASLPIATISTGVAVVGSAVGAILIGTVGMLLLKPQRQSLIAQASEHATKSMAEAFTRLETELRQSRDEVKRLTVREADLLRRIEQLEDDGRRELERLRRREADLLEQIAKLEAELARHSD